MIKNIKPRLIFLLFLRKSNNFDYRPKFNKRYIKSSLIKMRHIKNESIFYLINITSTRLSDKLNCQNFYLYQLINGKLIDRKFQKAGFFLFFILFFLFSAIFIFVLVLRGINKFIKAIQSPIFNAIHNQKMKMKTKLVTTWGKEFSNERDLILDSFFFSFFLRFLSILCFFRLFFYSTKDINK